MVELEQAVESDADGQVLRQNYVQLGSEKVDMALSKQPNIMVDEVIHTISALSSNLDYHRHLVEVRHPRVLEHQRH